MTLPHNHAKQDSQHPQRKRPRHSSTAAADTNGSRHDRPDATTPTSDAEHAFQSALRASLLAGVSMPSAVRSLLGNDDTTKPSAATRAEQTVLKALSKNPALNDDIPAVAHLCQSALTACNSTQTVPSRFQPRPPLPLKLRNLHDAADIIANAHNIVVLLGAGVSVSAGIPDFRSPTGLYAKLLRQHGLHDPQTVFDLREFREDPSLFYTFAHHLLPAGDVQPSAAHAFVAALERRGLLRRVYSQNVDGLEAKAGISDERVVLCHGSFRTASCMRAGCGARVDVEVIADEVRRGIVPRCGQCLEGGGGKRRGKNRKRRRGKGRRGRGKEGWYCDDSSSEGEGEAGSIAGGEVGVMKPDIVFFGERLPDRVARLLDGDMDVGDLVLVMGTSLKVAPVSRMPHTFGRGVPRVVVNREPVGVSFDVELMGDCDVVVRRLACLLGWGLEEVGGGTEGVGTAEEGVVFVPPRRFVFDGAAESVLREAGAGSSEGGEGVGG